VLDKQVPEAYPLVYMLEHLCHQISSRLLATDLRQLQTKGGGRGTTAIYHPLFVIPGRRKKKEE